MAISTLRRIFAGDKPPLFLVLFFGALAWATTRYADSLAEAPVVEYSVEQSDSKISVHLENLARAKTFDNVVFVLRTSGIPGGLSSPVIVAHQPAWEGRTGPVVEGETATFDIEKFHPAWKFTLQAEVAEGLIPSLQLRGSSESMRLLQPSVETWMLRHQYQVLIIIFIVWAALTTGLLLKGGGDEQSVVRPERLETAEDDMASSGSR